MTAESARTVAAAFISSRLDYCNSLLCDLPNTLLRNLQSVCAERHHTTDHWHASPRPHRAGTTRAPLAANHRVLSSKWLAWFASHCPGRHLSTWQMIVALCLTGLGVFSGLLMPRLAWYYEHTAAMATELLQPLDLVCGTLYRSSCAIQTLLTE